MRTRLNWQKVAARACRPIDGASLVAFRILFGALMAFAAVRFLAHGWVDALFVQPTFHFTFQAFPFVHPGPAWAMHALFVLLAVFAVGIAAGLAPRICALGYFLGFTYVELCDKAYYLNHYYLITLLAGLMVLVPIGRLHARSHAPLWTLWLFRFQAGVVYVFAGVAKLNADWLVHAQPLRMWLSAHADLPVAGGLLGQPAVAYAASWAAAAFDLGVVPLLLWRRTRRFAFITVVAFHLMTALLFPVGMFPWIMIAAATLFLDPGWPRRLGMWQAAPVEPLREARPPAVLATVLILHALVQVLLPLRQHVLPGPSAWTGAGFNFAWNVMVAEKSGHVSFDAHVPGEVRSVPVDLRRYVTPLQEEAMAQDPDMVHALAAFIAADLRRPDTTAVEIHADAFASLNGRAPRRFARPDVDVAARPPAAWLLPLSDGPLSSPGALTAQSRPAVPGRPPVP